MVNNNEDVPFCLTYLSEKCAPKVCPDTAYMDWDCICWCLEADPPEQCEPEPEPGTCLDYLPFLVISFSVHRSQEE